MAKQLGTATRTLEDRGSVLDCSTARSFFSIARAEFDPHVKLIEIIDRDAEKTDVKVHAKSLEQLPSLFIRPDDGTVAPWAVVASLPFAPDIGFLDGATTFWLARVF